MIDRFREIEFSLQKEKLTLSYIRGQLSYFNSLKEQLDRYLTDHYILDMSLSVNQFYLGRSYDICRFCVGTDEEEPRLSSVIGKVAEALSSIDRKHLYPWEYLFLYIPLQIIIIRLYEVRLQVALEIEI